MESIKEGHAALQVQRWKEAIQAYQRAIDIDPKAAEAYGGMSIAHQALKQPGKAREMADKALKLNQKSAIGHFAMAKVMYTEGQYEEALKENARAIELFSNMPSYYWHRGEIYFKLRNTELALQDFHQACKMNHPLACKRAEAIQQQALFDKKSLKDSGSGSSADQRLKAVKEYIEAGHAALRNQNWDQALTAFTRARELEPKSAEACGGMSLAYQAMKQMGKAREMANKALELNPKNAIGHYAIAKVMYTEGQYEEALKENSRAIELFPKAPSYYWHRGEIYDKLRNAEKALQDLQQACKMNLPVACKRAEAVQQQALFDKKSPKDSGSGSSADQRLKAMKEYIEAGHAALRNQNWDQALTAFTRARELEPKSAEACGGMSLAHQAMKQTEKAKEMANKALELNPKNAIGHYAMANNLFFEGQYDQALESVNRAIEIYPKSPYYILLRGEIHLKRQNVDLAAKDFTQACKMNLPRACRRAENVKRE